MASECGAYGTAMNSTTGSAKDASNAPHALNLWADGQKVATLGYEAMNDRWSLDYDAPWVALPEAFPLSPALPFEPPSSGYAAGAVKRFVENLLPEGRALDITATSFRVSKSNIYALISALGTETTGAFRFWRSDEVPPTVAAKPPREVTRDELDRRIAERDQIPLAVWDGKVRVFSLGRCLLSGGRHGVSAGRLCAAMWGRQESPQTRGHETGQTGDGTCTDTGVGGRLHRRRRTRFRGPTA